MPLGVFANFGRHLFGQEIADIMITVYTSSLFRHLAETIKFMKEGA